MQSGKQLIKWIGKVVGAGIAAFILLNLFCLFYANIGVHTTNSTGATDYIWEPNGFFSRLTEGITYGRLDSQGFNNSYPAEDEVDILLMGSSHMEAFQMRQHENVGYQLNRLLHQDGSSGDYVYNIGTSGHGFTDCISNLPYAMKQYHPRKAVVIEMTTLGTSESQVNAVLEGTRSRIPSYDHGLIHMLQQFPYLQLVYRQLKEGGQAGGADLNITPTASKAPDEAYAEAVNALLRQAADWADGVELILFYHPALQLDRVGNASADVDQKQMQVFSAACKEYGITFVDMTDTFMEAYEKDHILPYGFANTEVGVGHLNRHGHRMIAQELAKVLSSMEGNA